ncbi:MAG: hypothetical protein RXR82_07175 [Nitrososphaeria archaeon]
MSEMVRPHGKIQRNADGTFTITTNRGYQFTVKSIAYSTALGESTLDLLMQIADVVGQMLESMTVNPSTGAVSVRKVTTG